MPLPDFFLIGAPKCGTSALYGALRRHPEIFMPKRKEPHFFSYDPAAPAWRLRPEVTEPLDYFALFSGVRAERAVGEASTSYLGSPCAARRIRAQIPEARIVAVLRDPVERAYSSYWFYVTLGRECAASFEQAIAYRGAPTGTRMGRHHLRGGLYHAHLSAWYKRFPREQIRVYLYEDWRERPQEMLRDLFTFLGVDPDVTSPIPERNITRAPHSRWLHRSALRSGVPWLEQISRRYNTVTPPPLSAATARELREFYRDDILRLQGLIDRDLSRWLCAGTSIDRASDVVADAVA